MSLEIIRRLDTSASLDKNPDTTIRKLLEALKRIAKLEDFDVDRPNHAIRGTWANPEYFPTGMNLNYLIQYQQDGTPADVQLAKVLEVYQQFKAQIMLLASRVRDKDEGPKEHEIKPGDFANMELNFVASWLAADQLIDKANVVALLNNIDIDTNPRENEIRIQLGFLAQVDPVIEVVNLSFISDEDRSEA